MANRTVRLPWRGNVQCARHGAVHQGATCANVSTAMTYAYGERRRTAAWLSPSTLTTSTCPRARTWLDSILERRKIVFRVSYLSRTAQYSRIPNALWNFAALRTGSCETFAGEWKTLPMKSATTEPITKHCENRMKINLASELKLSIIAVSSL